MRRARHAIRGRLRPVRRRSGPEDRCEDVAPVSNLQSVIVVLSVGYALIGALLLLVLVYARLPWSAKAVSAMWLMNA